MLGDEASIVTLKKDLENAKQEEIIKSDTARINVQWVYDVYILGLKYSMPSPETGGWQANTNVFLVYIYSILTISQGIVSKVYNKLNTNEYIKNLKKMKMITNEEIEIYRQELLNCSGRLNVYEMILKKMFQIPYKESNLINLGKYFPKFEDLTKSQIDIIKYAIVDPLFFGKFHNVYGNKILTLTFDIKEDGTKSNFKLGSLNNFPFPKLDQDGFSAQDCLKPLYIYNEIAWDIKKSVDILNNMKWYHKMLAGLFGMSPSTYIGEGREGKWVYDVKDWISEKAGQAGETVAAVADAAAALANNMYEATKSAASYLTTGPSGDSFTKTALKIGVAGLIGYIIVKEIG